MFSDILLFASTIVGHVKEVNFVKELVPLITPLGLRHIKDIKFL